MQTSPYSRNVVGSNNPFFGRKHSEETKEKMRLAKLGLRGEKTNRWRGDKAGYRALHIWVQKTLGKASFCSNDKSHNSVVYYWGNISGEYKRDVADWHSLCPKCNATDGVRKHKRFAEGSVL